MTDRGFTDMAPTTRSGTQQTAPGERDSVSVRCLAPRWGEGLERRRFSQGASPRTASDSRKGRSGLESEKVGSERAVIDAVKSPDRTVRLRVKGHRFVSLSVTLNHAKNIAERHKNRHSAGYEVSRA
jgi:hypothetical protein